MTSSELLKDVRTITQNNLEIIRKKFSHLTLEQLKWSPSESNWNIEQIFAHLNAYASFYHQSFTSRISKTRFTDPSENFQSSPLGRSAWKSMKLGNAKNIKRKFNATKNYNPQVSIDLIKGHEIERFQTFQNELLAILETATNINIRKVKVSISMSKIIKLRLGDALLFVAYHNERHMQQALNVINHPKFPKR